jgi:hypothetical protein
MNVLLLSPGESDATSYYRAWGPFGEAARQIPSLHLFKAEKFAWNSFSDKHLLVLQRPCVQSHLDILTIAKRAGCLTWADWDDLLWDIPDGNPAKMTYGLPQTVKAIILKIAQAVDMITVSTEFLKLQFPDFIQPKIHVIHNRLPSRWCVETIPQKSKDILKVLWRGSRTHDPDWLDFLPVVEAFNTQQKTEWLLVGSPPYHVIDHLAQTATVQHIQEIPLEIYFDWMIDQGPQADIMFVPLRDMTFNRVKSNIAMLEATFGGMLTVAPKWAEWETGILEVDSLLYTSPQDALACLKKACTLSQQGTFKHITGLQEHYRQAFARDDERFLSLFTAKNLRREVSSCLKA